MFKNKNKKIKLEKPFLAGALIKMFLFASVAVLAVGGNFFAEGRLALNGPTPVKELSSFDYTAENHISENGLIRFGQDDSGITNNASILTPTDDLAYVFDLQSGKIWGNFTLSNADVNINVGRVVLIPDRATFDLRFDGARLNLAVYNGDVYLGFLAPGVTTEEYVDRYSDIFMNTLLVPRDSQVEISMSKVDERIEQLLYSKLVKEFKYAAIPSVDRDSQWVKENRLLDQKFIEDVRNELRSEVIFKGNSGDSGVLSDFVFWAEENLTFVPNRNRQIVFNHLFAFLDDAIFYAVDGDQQKSAESLGDFEIYLSSLPLEVSESEEFFNKFDDYLYRLSIFGPSDPQYKLYLDLLSKKFVQNRDVFEVVNLVWLEVYDGLDVSDVLAEKALNTYYGYFDSTLKVETDDAFYNKYLTHNNLLLDNLLLRYSGFYKDSYFAIKNALEQELLNLFDEGRAKDELKQDLITNKISFLKRLRTFFFEGDVNIAEAKRIFSRLIEEIDDLMTETSSEAAVVELFEIELEDIGDFWGYLNSPEYHTSLVYGRNHQERYQSYLEEKDRIWSFINIQEDVLGEDDAEMNVADVIDEVNDFFQTNSNVSQIDIGEIDDVNQRYIPVEGVIGGYPFEARYDRDNGTVSEVYTYGELISDRALQLDSMLALLKEKFADFTPDTLLEDEVLTEETFAQRAARLYIAELVAGVGFEITIDNVQVVDEFNATYRVENVILLGMDDVPVTFDFLMNGEMATNVFLEVSGSPVVLNGKFNLEQLAAIVVAEGDFDPSGSENNSSKVLR